jgi:flagellar biosynthesis GTPase FlhF
MTSPLDTASSLLLWSNVIYVVGAVLTLGTSALVLFEKRQAGKGIEIKHSVRNEVFFVTSALICLAGTCGAIYFSNKVSDIKDTDLAAYKTSAGLQIAQSNKDAAKAISDAATANKSAEETKQANLRLQSELTKHEGHEQEAEAKLAAQNKETSDFAHSLQQQQATMQEQAKVSPQLTPYQIQALANVLRPFAGQDVSLHITSDTVVARLGATIHMAFDQAGVTAKSYSADMGALYQGVSVAVHDPNDVPPIANALIIGLRQAGIDVHPVAAPQMVPAHQVAIFLGPN